MPRVNDVLHRVYDMLHHRKRLNGAFDATVNETSLPARPSSALLIKLTLLPISYGSQHMRSYPRGQ